MNKLVFGLTLLSLVSLAHSNDVERYRATFDKSVTGVSGRFKISNRKSENALYAWSINANDFISPGSGPDQCDLSEGLSYHIHSYWNDNDEDSAKFGDCGATNTGGHYDPFLACGGATSSAAECTDLNRTSNDYMCDTSVYSAGEYQRCEVGDLSGKFGKMMPTSANDLTFSGKVMNDFLGPLDVNYDVTEEGTTKSWVSIVFHCASGGSRQFCAKFNRI